MPRLSGYQIRNFKGIEAAAVAVEGGKSPGRFITLVGLNESGKTSVIEALSLSVLQDPDTADLLQATNTATDMSEVVPKHLSASFTGDFEISAAVEFEDDQVVVSQVKSVIDKAGYALVKDFSTKITISKMYRFIDSNYKDHRTTWSFDPKVRKKSGTKTLGLHDMAKTVWLSCLSVFKQRLPQSIYFPTFLVDFPRRIYLEGKYGIIDSYYRKVVSDVLSSLKEPLTIDSHIIGRVNKHRASGEAFSSALRSSKEGAQIDATVQALASEINTVVFGAWSEVFNKTIKSRRIVVEWHIDEEKNNHIYLEFYIIAGDFRFSIPERSLGFRWFFSFLLFTQFQRSRTADRKVIFLFDEPASHLHPKAQERLLKSFEKIAEPNHVIIYSTHSHYLINPLWLEQVHIVSNEALDVEQDDTGIDSVDAKVRITTQKYKKFASENASKTTYYQPVLDVLDYSAGGLSLEEPVVILEGKYDYYPLKYMVESLGRDKEFRIVPAVGAGGLSALVSILRGWGLRFIILLDDDAAGRKEKGKYRNDLLLTTNQVVTIDELDIGLKGREFEALFKDDVIQACKNAGVQDAKGAVGKSELYSYFQALRAGLVQPEPMPDTITAVTDFLDQAATRLAAQAT